MIELFYIGMPVVRTDGLSGGQSVYGHVITKFSQMGRLLHFLTHGAVLVRFVHKSSTIKVTQNRSYIVSNNAYKSKSGMFHLPMPHGYGW